MMINMTNTEMERVIDITIRVVRIVTGILSDVRSDVHTRHSASLQALYRSLLPTFTYVFLCVSNSYLSSFIFLYYLRKIDSINE
jgi:hypothetical protein